MYQIYEHEFSFTQEEVARFAQVTGDTNPLHLDDEFAAGTPFKKPIMHGMIAASVFSKVLGTEFPGSGSVYLAQTLEFKRPMYAGVAYIASFEVLEVNAAKGTATIATVVKDKATSKLAVEGKAQVMNKEKFGSQRVE